MINRLYVTIDFGAGTNECPVGQMGWDGRARHAVLEWDRTFVAAPLPISPVHIKSQAGLLRPTSRAYGDLPAVFGDSLPDGWGKLLVDRELQARGVRLDEITDMDRLAMVGTAGMGALAYRPAQNPNPEGDFDLDWFERLVPKVEGGATAGELERLRAVAGGSQGVRPKFVAQLAADGARLRDHRTALEKGWRHVLMKRRALQDPVGTVEVEAAYAMMARAAGIEMSWTGVLRATSGEPFFATERFDRPDGRRLHMQTFAALFGVDFREAYLDYKELLRLTRFMTRDARAVEQIYRRMVFNARTRNRDDHLKNHAFLMDAAGSWRLAPAYDVTYSSGPGGEHTLTIADEGRRPGREAFAAVARESGISARRAAEIVDEVDGAAANWLEYADATGVPPQVRREISEQMERAAGW